jgi:DNA-binding HxlR family transcriptional regulator
MRIDECPVKATVDVIGGKWKPLILRELKDGPRRFGILRRAISGMRHKVLTEQLKQLEAEGIVSRTEHPGVLPHTEYKLSEYGETLRPILVLMAEWGLHHQAKTSPMKTGFSRLSA